MYLFGRWPLLWWLGGGENSFLPLAPSHCIAPEFSASHQWIWRREEKAQLHFKLLNLEITLFTSAHICLQSMQVAVQVLSCFWLFATPWTAAHQASLSFTVSQSLLKFMPHWVGDTIPPSHPLLPSSFAFSLFPGSTRVHVHSGWPENIAHGWMSSSYGWGSIYNRGQWPIFQNSGELCSEVIFIS